ncbi:MAG: extracellular solute-binding protein, partial [Cyanobacteria bacterium P01_D01_bin.128]
MNRRHFLTLVSIALASQPLSACGAGANRDRSAQIALLEDAIPDQLIRTFRRRLSDGVQLRLTAASQFADLYDLLLSSQAAMEPGAEPDQAEQSETRQFWQFWRRSTPTSADLISLSDNWLSAAIQQDLIQPLALAELHAWSTLDSRWQALVTRTTAGAPSDGLPSTDAKLWGAPYRWGYLMLTYRDRPLRQLGGAPTDWDALWRPELQNQIALPDNPHLVLAIVLRKLGLSANLVDLTPHLADLEAALTQLNQQVKFYSSTHHLQALVTEGVSLAAGWSTDILPLLRR